MGYLTREAILAAHDLETQDVAVPEWGGVVRVRALTGAERDQFELSMGVQGGSVESLKLENVRAKLVALAVVDENGERLFRTEDVEKLGAKSAAALQRVFMTVQRLSGLTKKDIESLEKNSSSGQNNGSGTS